MEKKRLVFCSKVNFVKTLQIPQAVLFRCVKQCSVILFTEVCFVFKILHMQKSTQSPSSVFKGAFVEQQAGRQAVYFVQSNQTPQNLGCLFSESKENSM